MFVPVYLDGTLPAALACEGDGGAWACFSRLQSVAERDAHGTTRAVRDAYRPLEAAIESERIELEREARRATAARDVDRVDALLSPFMARTVDAVLERTDALARQLG